MRATINFDVDVQQVEGTMAVLSCSEEHNLRAAADILSNHNVLDGSVLDAITEVLRLLDASVGQLKQYQQMMISFEQSKFQTMIPQAIPDQGLVNDLSQIREATETMQRFDTFINKVNDNGGPDEPEEG